jgi:hypothetical protein
MKKRLTFEEMMEAPTPVTFINEGPIDFTVVDFVVREETARQRADRRWGMTEEEEFKC